MTKEAVGSEHIDVPVLIVGAGFGGIAMAMALKKAGIGHFRIVERAADVGGVWRDNSYPGAACDIVSSVYSLSHDTKYPWSDIYGPRDEIVDHIHGVVDRHDLRRHITFGVDVRTASFCTRTGLWTVEAADGRCFRTPVFISAVGLFNRAFIPAVPGRDDFLGPQFHSAAWRHDVDLNGKSIVVVGNGASCVQFLPRIAPQARRVTLLQRTPQYVMPKAGHPGSGRVVRWMGKNNLLKPLARLHTFLNFELIAWRRLNRPAHRRAGEKAFRDMLERKVPDPVLRKKLTPDYSLGCKRVLVSDHWYEALNRPNVEVVTDRISKIVPGGVVTADNTFHPADVLVWGTGYTPTDYLQPMRITGIDKLPLEQAWRNGAEAYLGMTVSGFPNFFMMYGPNTNAFSSIVYMLECQARYIVKAIALLGRRRSGWLDVRQDIFRAFNDEMQDRLSKTVAAEQNCLTYTKTEQGRLTTNWPGYALEFRLRTRKIRPSDFVFGSAGTEPDHAS